MTAVEPLGKTRSKVFLDQEFAFVLYKGELRLFRIAVGSVLSEEDYCKIMSEILPVRAKKRAMNLLMKREYTEYKLREKLREGEYPDRIIDEALEYVRSFRYIDDERYATDFFSDHADLRSRRRMEQDLSARGISGEVIQRAYEKWQESGGEQDEIAMMRKLLEKRKFDPNTASREERARAAQFLIRKGFPWEKVRRVLDFGGCEEC
ncbi:MAG: regulatory protein RecX [Acetatifactor sp.]